MKLSATIMLFITSLAVAVPAEVKREAAPQPIPIGADYALLQARCSHLECKCTGWDPNSCSGPGCGKQCNTGH